MAPAVSAAVDGATYVQALANYIKQHERKLADFVNHQYANRKHTSAPSWTSILTLGIAASGSSPASTSSPAQAGTTGPKQLPLVLRFDPHHLYYMLLRFDELGIPKLGPLSSKVDGGHARPMTLHQHTDMPHAGRRSLAPDSDTMSFTSGFSSFSIGSGWWGTSTLRIDEATNVKYLYSSCTKLPALRLSPFTFPLPSSASSKSSKTAALSKAVEGFEDCPPPDTAVPLYAFRNLSSLVLDDLDPRAFVGWDVLSVQLRSLEVHNSGIEDVGELLCDVVVEDAEMRQFGTEVLGRERKRRQRGITDVYDDDHTPEHERDSGSSPSSLYPIPPSSAWSQLRHLSLSNNALTFVPSPPLTHLSVLTSLDLSSNLLISIPTGLDSLHSLRSLNLSDNMIESLVGIHKTLGNVQVVNLSKNRLDNLSGLDRLFALERLDVRHNRLAEALEVSRLSSLPCLREVWVKGNPFANDPSLGGEAGYRVKCFNYFAKEGKFDVLLDGTSPGMTEKRSIAQPHKLDNGNSPFSGENRADGETLLATAATSASRGRRSASVNVLSGSTDKWSDGKTNEPVASGRTKIVERRRMVTTPHANPVVQPATSSDKPVDSCDDGQHVPVFKPVHKSRQRKPPRRIVDLDTDSVAPASRSKMLGDEMLSDSSDGQRQTKSLVDDALKSSVIQHDDQHDVADIVVVASPQKSSSVGPLAAQSLNNKRGDRVSASLYESGKPLTASVDASGNASSSGNEGEGLRGRIERLRNEVGESWLSVLNEREAELERKKMRQVGETQNRVDAGTDKGLGESLVAGVVPSEPEAPAQEDHASTLVKPEGNPVERPDRTDPDIPTQSVKVVKKKRKGKKK
ncbi:hypothetical protein OIV83_001238 [Microbotryomycetes sp. JL201]|nr:hypothetical protein OIV83_001238 [Microbotryomycetes sp. JL201]